MPRLPVRTSRRATTLKDSDYDHEISLVDHDAELPEAEAAEAAGSTAELPLSPSDTADLSVARHSTASELLAPTEDEGRPSTSTSNRGGGGGEDREREGHGGRQNGSTTRENAAETSELQNEETRNTWPSIAVEMPTPFQDLPERQASRSSRKDGRSRADRESAIDILFENERGGFLCGLALFSSKALGNLDPPPWTNAFHKASPTNIHTAQVPDPSWEWAWPEWHINRDEGVDEGGWVYSFMFARRFKWHGPKWWNSFVRRRTWTRKRVKKRPEDVSSDPHMLNTDYFTVRPASASSAGGASRSPSRSRRESNRRSKGSISIASNATPGDEPLPVEEEWEEGGRPDVEEAETLLRILRRARIDREKIEAVESYLAHAADDLAGLPGAMHEIMGLLVFQASRRLLLSKLMQAHEEAAKAGGAGAGDDKTKRSRRQESLSEAVKHADEEVRKLAYWSDVKRMAEGGESQGAVDDSKGWHDGWQGVDKSGPAHPGGDHRP